MRELARTAELRISLTEEVAADIFMGEFTEPFVRAAQFTASTFGDTLYGRYFDLPAAELLSLVPLQERHGKKVSPEFAELCVRRLPPRPTHWSVGYNGAVIEQQLILTSHNLAPLTAGLSLQERLLPAARSLAERCLRWGLRHLETEVEDWRIQLQRTKNAAYAFRQMLFFLSLLTPALQTTFVSWSWELLGQSRPSLQSRFRPALVGLEHIVRGGRFDEAGFGGDGGRRFLGWSVGRHWLVPNPFVA